MGILGCGQNIVVAQERGGGTVLGELAYTDLGYGRVLDDMSSANLSVGPAGLALSDCCDVLDELEAWRHEIAVYRDGNFAWVGPITRLTFTTLEVRIEARDLFQWFERRTLPYDRTFTATSLGEIFGTFALDALDRDPSPNITVMVGPTSASGDRQVFAAQRRRAADELRELARSGVDYTMIGRNLRGGGDEVPTSELATLGADTLLDPNLVYEGLQTATEVAVVGQAAEDPEAPVLGTAGGVSGVYGLIEYTGLREPTILDTASANAAAQTRLEMMGTPPIYLSGTLAESVSIGFNDLVPGARIGARLGVGCRSLDASLRLRAVQVGVRPEGNGALERVEVQLVPLGSTSLEGA